MNLAEPKIVCIMPCYNAEKTLAKAIESVTNQNYTNWELIIVDDASTDNSVKVAKNYLKDSRITLLQNKTNRGCYYSRNRAIYHVKDEKWDWLTIHDSDDTSHPDRFAIFMATAYHGNYDYIYSSGNGTRFNYETQKLEFVQNAGAPGQAFIAYGLFHILGYFDSSVRHSADSEHAYRFLQILTLATKDYLKTLSNPTTVDILKYCYDNKQLCTRLKDEYTYTYTWGYHGKNLTRTVSREDREKYKEYYRDKWGKGGLTIQSFYQNFEPHIEDITLK